MIRFLLPLFLLQGDPGELPRLKPTEPADAIKTFKLAPGVRMELVASEPLVSSPVDMAFDELGRLWVVEMIDYPFNEKEGNPPQGRLKRLEDADGDGRFDKAEVMADKIAWPTGLALWDGGAYVIAAPYLYSIKEGVRKVVYTGFGTQNVQALPNNLKWGLDNWFHGSGGGNGGTIVPAGISINGRDFRFRPSGEFETQSGGGQFGGSFDDFGRKFVCSNSVQARHVVLDDAALRRNPYYAVSGVTASIAADGDAGPVFRASPYEPWRVARTKMREAGIVKGIIEPMGSFTSATGVFFHDGLLYVGDVSSNLVHRKKLVPNGSTFRAERIDEKSEFIASSDNWFRPANFATGPDGALYICDMYRECIEHPQSLPDSIKKQLDLTSGKERGRIWRVGGGKWAKPNFDDLPAALARPESWWRQTAGRLIYRKQDKSIVPALEALLSHERPETRAAALWALDGLGVRAADKLLRDPSPDVREQAVRLASLELLRDYEDPAPRVRLQLAYRLTDKAALEKLKPGADRWLATAIALASGEKTAERTPKKVVSPTSAPVLVGDRKKLLETYRPALEKKGDVARGREIYRKICAACHKSGPEGKEVGPDLATVKLKTPEELMTAILDPNREVNPQYQAVRILTTSGLVLDGLVSDENATSVTLKRQGGEVETILKVRIDKMVKSALSLMPEGVEKDIDAQGLADLIEFLRN